MVWTGGRKIRDGFLVCCVSPRVTARQCRVSKAMAL